MHVLMNEQIHALHTYQVTMYTKTHSSHMHILARAETNITNIRI